MSSGGRGEEPIDLNPNMRQHYARQLLDCGCSPRCERCRESWTMLVAAGQTPPARPDQRPGARPWLDVLVILGITVFAVTCLASLTIG